MDSVSVIVLALIGLVAVAIVAFAWIRGRSVSNNVYQTQPGTQIQSSNTDFVFDDSGMPFSKRLINTIHYIDPDTSRFVEYIWATRYGLEVSTFSDSRKIPHNAKGTFKDMQEIIKEHFEIIYSNPRFIRALRHANSPWGEQYADFYVVAEKNEDMLISAIGNEADVVALMAAIDKRFTIPASIEVKTLVGYSDSSPATSSDIVIEGEAALAFDEFYPYFKDFTIDELVEAYQASSADALILIGPRGTGKSTFLRTLMLKIKAKMYALADQESLLADPRFTTFLRSLGTNAVIGIEDADNLIKPRSSGNAQMSMILNYLDGVVDHNTKMIISTNLPTLRETDEALVRKGRTFRVLEFQSLYGEQINVARGVLGKDPIEVTDETKMTLAEALNYDPDDNSLRTVQTIGFGGRSQ